MEEALTGRHPLPHITVLVDVDEGRRVGDRSVLAHPDEVSIGMVVRAISKRAGRIQFFIRMGGT